MRHFKVGTTAGAKTALFFGPVWDFDTGQPKIGLTLGDISSFKVLVDRTLSDADSGVTATFAEHGGGLYSVELNSTLLATANTRVQFIIAGATFEPAFSDAALVVSYDPVKNDPASGSIVAASLGSDLEIYDCEIVPSSGTNSDRHMVRFSVDGADANVDSGIPTIQIYSPTGTILLPSTPLIAVAGTTCWQLPITAAQYLMVPGEGYVGKVTAVIGGTTRSFDRIIQDRKR